LSNAGERLPVGLWVHQDAVEECAAALAAIGGRTLQSVGFTSCFRGEGRSTIATAAAVVQASSYGRKTILVEFDFEKPSLASRLGLATTPGLADSLSGSAPLASCVQWCGDDMGVLVAGDNSRGLPGLLSAVDTSDVFEQLTELCDVIVVDLPPVLPTGLDLRMMARCETIVMVVRAGVTAMKDIRRASETLQSPPPVILNRTTAVGPAWLDSILGGSQ
jgi:Mrp family chromosome partitioning ATPase